MTALYKFDNPEYWGNSKSITGAWEGIVEFEVFVKLSMYVLQATSNTFPPEKRFTEVLSLLELKLAEQDPEGMEVKIWGDKSKVPVDRQLSYL